MPSDITVDVGETLSVVFDFAEELKVPWRPNYQYSTLEFIQVDSLVYECTNAGKTGANLPENFSTTIGGTQADGTVEWTVRDYSATSGTDTISTKTVTASSAALTVDASAIDKSLYVTATFTAVSKGSHSIVCEIVTAAGETLRHTYKVFVA